MTSLFDPGESFLNDPLPVELVEAGGRSVSVLEYFELEEEVRRRREDEEANIEALPKPKPEITLPAHQVQVMIDAARQEALTEASDQFEQAMESRLELERERVARACSEFAMDRQRYFAAAEAQVVKLAMSIAKKVLSKAVEADPMHLEATVRAALARVLDGSSSVLRVCAAEHEQWQEMFAGVREGAVTVVAEAQLEPGDCILETHVGRVELGVNVQLQEIERGFGDLLRRQGE